MTIGLLSDILPNIVNKRLLFIFFFALLVAGSIFVGSSQFNKENNEEILGTDTKETKVIEKDTPSETPVILNTATEDSTLIAQQISCIGPDGKAASASQADCDNLWNFWNSQPKHTGNSASPSNNSSSNNSSSNSSTPTPTPTTQPTSEVTATPTLTITPTPTEASEEEPILPIITDVNILDCTSPSCGGISTLVINGTDFTADTVVYLFDINAVDFTFFGEDTGDAVRVGGDGVTKIITDFYNLPCSEYIVVLVFPSLGGVTYTEDALVPPYCN